MESLSKVGAACLVTRDQDGISPYTRACFAGYSRIIIYGLLCGWNQSKKITAIALDNHAFGKRAAHEYFMLQHNISWKTRNGRNLVLLRIRYLQCQ